MPFKSKSQMRKFYAMEERGEIPKGTVDKWKKHTKNISSLPEKKKKLKKGSYIIDPSFLNFISFPELCKLASFDLVPLRDFLRRYYSLTEIKNQYSNLLTSPSNDKINSIVQVQKKNDGRNVKIRPKKVMAIRKYS